MWSSKVHRHLLLCSGRNISLTGAVSVSHYDVLGITPKATQAEVKAAYYKLSKLHHPDININDKDANGDKFRLISEAYEVLGNYRSRQMYDKGLYGHSRLTEKREDKKNTPEDPRMSFYKSRLNKTRVPTSQSSTNIYNFDEWTRQHYSKTFAKSNASFKRREGNVNAHPQEVLADDAFLKLSGLAIFFAVIGVTLLNMSTTSSDIPRPKGSSGKVD